MPDLNIFNPPPPGELDRLRLRLAFFPGLTQYQQFCLRIADRSLDLPAQNREHEPVEGLAQRHKDRLDMWVVDRWLLEATEIDGLAAMVMLDAMEYFVRCLDFMTDNHEKEAFDSRFKREFTQRIQGIPFVFRIPSGWELALFHDRYDEGNYGLGFVQRCHLSHSTQENWGLGELLGRGSAYSTDVGYFHVPCTIVPHFKRMPIDADDERWGLGTKTVTALIPYQWITHTWVRNSDDGKSCLRPVASENEVLGVAVRAIDAVRDVLAEIATRMREAGGRGHAEEEAGK